MSNNPADLFNDDNPDRFGHLPVEGVITAAPASLTALVKVAIPAFDMDQSESLRWMPRGASLPSVGDRCLVVFTTDGTAWVPAWWPG